MLDFIRFGVKLNGEQYDIILAKGAFLSNDSSLYISLLASFENNQMRAV